MKAEALIEEYFRTGTLAALPRGQFIDGAFCAAADGAEMPSHDPGTGAVFGHFPAAGRADVERAVAAAGRGLQTWRQSRPAERCQVLARTAALIRERAELLAVVETLDSGKTLTEARGDVASAARLFEYYAGAADKLEGRSIPLGPDHMCWTVREPVGIAAHIIPWNYPTSTFARGVAPALAAGCSVVAKPAETTPYTALLMAAWLHEAGVPAGAINVVTGTGAEAGAPLASHPDVAHITFTGSVGTGVGVMQAAAPNVARLTLELGGKSPLIALGDCDVAAAAEAACWAIFSNAGQICSAGSRLIVERSIHAELIERLVKLTAAIRVGHGLRETDVGAINSALQLERIDAHVRAARERGRAIVCGGAALPGPGWYYAPTVIDDLPTDDACVQQEIFGPVLAVQVVDSAEEALAAANATDYGLWAGVYTRDVGKALRLARDIDAGQVTINDYWAGGVEVPFGGTRKSGFGKEKGLQGIDAYTHTKCITARL